ncbi:hypothetical protein E1301_Tti016032 [Triplophysa tibetana]|uniref:Apolipoprotein L6 n=1 Tax=Triplophysa tibetana TaxID=1572043 RepID=A0A5A9PCY5_9TELE|nr:hypothetical protein E1301_Tti016032 [Triplophysa tibetana]
MTSERMLNLWCVSREEENGEHSSSNSNQSKHNTIKECTFEVVPVAIAAYPTDEKPIEMDEDDDLIDWWKTVEGKMGYKGLSGHPEGINTLQEWNFKEYFESLANKSLQRNIKHVVKEGGRAGKALMMNTEKLIGTVKVLGVAGGAAQAAKAISVTTGVVSALFLALDVFFLAKDSNELRKGAKTKFASKIREVCSELQHGLLELNKVKTQLQKTMDGIEVEEYDYQGEVEDDDQDPIKLAQLEQELDQLEEELDRKATQMNREKGETPKKKGVEESSSKRKQ